MRIEMNIHKHRRYVLLSLTSLMLTGKVIAQTATPNPAQTYPIKLIRIVVPFPPGGPTDLYARIIGQKLQETWGQPTLVDNRPGGTGTVGTGLVQQSAPDGYTLLFTSNSAHVISPLLREPRPFDPVRNFSPITLAVRYPMYVLLHPSVPARSVAELITLARAKPGQLNYSSVGIGSGGHLACELFNLAAGTRIVHIPFKGAAPAQTALVSGETQMMCDSVGNSQALVDKGKLRGVAVTGAARSPAVPQVPTLKESTLPVEAYIWLGLLGPAGMSAALVNQLNMEVVRIMNLPDVRERVVKGGSDVIANTPDQFSNEMRAETATWARVIKEKGIKAE